MDHSALAEHLGQCLPGDQLTAVLDSHRAAIAAHGDWPRWQAIIEQLPTTGQGWEMDAGCLVAGQPVDQKSVLAELLLGLIPWRKGPLCLGGVEIETEWRSDWKWARVEPHVKLAGKRILDVGAGNGYYGWAMLAAGAASVLGCDPSILCQAQHRAIRAFAGPAANHLLAARLEDLPAAIDGFDCVFSMGVLYHRRDPAKHLADLHRRLRPGGQLVLETLIVPDRQPYLLELSGRYARMRNVYALPSLALLEQWLDKAGFEQIRTLDISQTSSDEQRSTEWMPFQSLAEALDPDDPGLTREGHPAPRRAFVCAIRKAPGDRP